MPADFCDAKSNVTDSKLAHLYWMAFCTPNQERVPHYLWRGALNRIGKYKKMMNDVVDFSISMRAGVSKDWVCACFYAVAV